MLCSLIHTLKYVQTKAKPDLLLIKQYCFFLAFSFQQNHYKSKKKIFQATFYT